MIFANRADAGVRLAKQLEGYVGDNLIVLAIPRGGVPVGYEIAKYLQTPLGIILVKKLGSLANPEFGMGAIAANGTEVWDEHTIKLLGITEEQIETIELRERENLEKRGMMYPKETIHPDLTYKTVILVDDGVATGVSARAAVKSILTKNPNKLIVAIPVGEPSSIEKLKADLRREDEVISLLEPPDFEAVGDFYKHFSQVTDEEVISLLEESRKNLKN